MNAVRRGLRVAGAPIRALLVGGIRAYRATLSGWLGGQCRFYPSCSHYAETAIRSRGAARGSILTLWRLARCNPFGRPGLDPAPGVEHDAKYDRVIQKHRIRPTGVA